MHLLFVVGLDELLPHLSVHCLYYAGTSLQGSLCIYTLTSCVFLFLRLSLRHLDPRTYWYATDYFAPYLSSSLLRDSIASYDFLHGQGTS
ncbi:hypothetical protein BDV25DRAFT_3361 [Aspergillus avenaceus]|uniref:Uncharacterized protein n=1 Tax=Aspergillus avenaceus TaxID=36643 RepID=A0A5N6TST4_ASPAV|nr:hypothetical protein BDV25DRAFT_3361 [Aspergillus avenaceus]